MGIKENLQKAYAEAQSGKFLAPTEAGIRVRVLVFKDENGEEQISRRVDNHFLGDKKSSNCLQSIGHDCPHCQEAEMLAAGTKEEQALANKIRAKKRFYLCAINTAVDVNQQKPQVLAVGKQAFDAIMSYFIDPEWEKVLLGPLATGRDFVIKKKGSGLDTEYTVQTHPSPTQVSKAAAAKVFDPITQLKFEGVEFEASDAAPEAEPEEETAVEVIEPEVVEEEEVIAPPPAKAKAKPAPAPAKTAAAPKAAAPAKTMSVFDKLRQKKQGA